MDSLFQFLILNQDRKRVIKELKITAVFPEQGMELKNIKI